MKKLFLLLPLALLLSSCEQPGNNTLYIKFNILAGTVPLQYNTDYNTVNNKVQFTNLKFYVGQPTLYFSGGETNEMTDKYFLCDAEKENVFDLGDVGKKNIEMIRMGFGVDSTRNTVNGVNAIPAYEYPSSHALSAANNMYWSWNPGYIWMKLEGRVDANMDGDYADAGEIFSYHTGVDGSFRTVTRSVSIGMNGNPRTIQIDLDILQFFADFDVAAYPDAHPLTTSHPDYNLMLFVQEECEDVFGQYYE